MYDGGRAVVVGVFAPRGRAERSADGFRVSGRWPFASGVQHCDWAMGGCVVQSDGEPELLPNGMPDVRLMLMPAASLEVLDTWSVAGLRGTGSHDMSRERCARRALAHRLRCSASRRAPRDRSTASRCSGCSPGHLRRRARRREGRRSRS